MVIGDCHCCGQCQPLQVKLSHLLLPASGGNWCSGVLHLTDIGGNIQLCANLPHLHFFEATYLLNFVFLFVFQNLHNVFSEHLPTASRPRRLAEKVAQLVGKTGASLAPLWALGDILARCRAIQPTLDISPRQRKSSQCK